MISGTNSERIVLMTFDFAVAGAETAGVVAAAVALEAAVKQATFALDAVAAVVDVSMVTHTSTSFANATFVVCKKRFHLI